MKITCQNCGQILPKTILVCPNCGGRQFSELNTSSQATTHPTQHHVVLTEQLVKQPETDALNYTEPYTHSNVVPSTPYAEASPPFTSPAIAPAIPTSAITEMNTQPVQPNLNYPPTF